MLEENTYLFKDMKEGDDLSQIVLAVKSRRADFCLVQGEEPQDINVIVAEDDEGFESKALKCEWGKKSKDDLMEFHGLDISKEIKSALVQEIAFEIYSLAKEKKEVQLYSLNITEEEYKLKYEVILKV